MSKFTNSKEENIVLYSPPALPINRPIFAGNPALISSETLPNGRPILTGSRPVISIDHLPLHRPVFHSESKIITMHGNRPIFRLQMNRLTSRNLSENHLISTDYWIQDHNTMEFLD